MHTHQPVMNLDAIAFMPFSYKKKAIQGYAPIAEWLLLKIPMNCTSNL